MENGKIKEGRHVYTDGTYYEGGWKNYQWEGKGKFYVFKNGHIVEIQEGNWIDNKKQGCFKIIRTNQQASYVDYSNDKQIMK